MGTTVLENIKVTDVDDVGGVLQIRCDFHPQVHIFLTYLHEKIYVDKVQNAILIFKLGISGLIKF